jgi:ABC-type dipeptide/oligopeptide/nickel transport system ATPase component
MTAQVISLDDRRLAHVAIHAPRTPWADFLTTRFRWRPGEHVGLIGPTGQGKTTLLHSILPLKRYVTVFATKPYDRSMEALERQGFMRWERWLSHDPTMSPKRILWPDATRMHSEQKQQDAFADAFDRIYRERNWTVAIDELLFMTRNLNLGREVRTYYTQARALDISLVAATQRPAWVPTEMYDQSTHLFLWRNNDARAQQRLGEINMVNSELVKDVVRNLEPHQALYINTRSGDMCRTRCPKIEEGG